MPYVPRYRRPRLFSPTAQARRLAVRRGLVGGDRVWIVIGAIVWGGRLLRRTFGRVETIAATEILKPGQFVRIEAIGPPTRKERKAQRRARKKSA